MDPVTLRGSVHKEEGENEGPSSRKSIVRLVCSGDKGSHRKTVSLTLDLGNGVDIPKCMTSGPEIGTFTEGLQRGPSRTKSSVWEERQGIPTVRVSVEPHKRIRQRRWVPREMGFVECQSRKNIKFEDELKKRISGERTGELDE